MKKLTVLFFIAIGVLYYSKLYAQADFSPGQQFNVAELQDDFTHLRNTLEKKHANLYLYTDKNTFNHFFDSLYAAINRPMTALEFYALITPLSSVVKNGHSYVLPGEKSREYYNKHELFTPLQIKWIDNKMYVGMNCSSDTTLKDSVQITAINGVAAEDIFATLLTRQVRDGNNTTYPTWILNNYFREYYSYVFGHPAAFNISYINADNATATTSLQALPKDSIKYYQRTKYAPSQETNSKGISLVFNNTTATLTIKTFDNDNLKEIYNQNFKTEIGVCFTQIKEKNAPRLILDLRDNQGGDPKNGILLLSHLLNHPFEMIHKGPVSAGIFQPADEPYTRTLYVLVNGGSFSNTGMVSACLAANNRGIFIGEETGGNQYILSGDAFTYTLPHTKIEYEIATTTYQLNDKVKTAGHGVIPAYTVTPDMQDIITQKDVVREFAEKLIASQKPGN